MMSPVSLPDSHKPSWSKTRHSASVLVITRYSSLASRLADYLNHHNYAVSAAEGLDKALPLIQQKRFDIVVIDWPDDGYSSLALCKQVRLIDQTIYIVMLVSTIDATRRRIAALDAGADDCLLKPLCLDEINARLRAYCRRIDAADRDIYYLDDLVLNPRTREVYRSDRPISLTAKEFDLLNYLLRHPQQVMTRDQILEHVWGYDFTGDSNIIEVYIRYLRLKLEAHNPKRLIHTVRYVGYVMRAS